MKNSPFFTGTLLGSPLVSLLTKTIGDDEAVVAAVKPTGTKVFWIRHDSNANEAVAQNAGVIAPRGGFALAFFAPVRPSLFLTAPPFFSESGVATRMPKPISS